MKILYLDTDPMNGYIGQQMLELEGHTADVLRLKGELTPGIENNYDALILDADAFVTPDRSKTEISEYLNSILEYRGKIHVVSTQTPRALRRDLGVLIARVNAHNKPFQWSDITSNLQ